MKTRIALAAVLLANGASAGSAAELELEREVALAGGGHITRYWQRHHGLPVLDGGLAVRRGAAGDVQLTHRALVATLPSSVDPQVTASQAASAAGRHTAFPVRGSDARLVVAPVVGGARLAWAFAPAVPPGLPTSPFILVDAADGRVLLVRDRIVFQRARVYPDNPVRTPERQLLPFPIAPAPGGLANGEVVSLTCADRGSVRVLGDLGFHVCDLLDLARPDASGDYDLPAPEAPSAGSQEDPFAQVSVFYHVGRAFTFFRELLDDPHAAVLHNLPITVVSNVRLPAGYLQGGGPDLGDPNVALQPYPNAFFTSGSAFGGLYEPPAYSLWFGQGPTRDFGYDGDAVYHELTHGVIGETLGLGTWRLDGRGLSVEPGAVNEALADFFAAAITGDPNIAEYVVGDLRRDRAGVRVLSGNASCPASLLGEEHYDSLVFSSALFSARLALDAVDQRVFDRAVYEGLLAHPGQSDLSFVQVAELLLESMRLNTSAGARALEAAFTARGVLPGCDRVLEVEGERTDAPLAEGQVRGWAAPASAETVGPSRLAPGILQFHVAMSARARRLRVTFAARETRPRARAELVRGTGVFTPVMLVKLERAITWTTDAAGILQHDADQELPASAREVFLEVPPGTAHLYLQVANAGDAGGLYDHLTVQSLPPAGTASLGALIESDGPSVRGGCVVSPRSQGPAGMAAVITLGAAWLARTRGQRRRFKARV